MPRNHRICALLAAWMSFACLAPAAATDTATVLRPALSMVTVDAGHASLRDTYLSPITYRGANIALGYEHFQAIKRNPEQRVSQIETGIAYHHAHNPAGNHTMHSLMGNFQWAVMRRWRNALRLPRSQVMIGPMLQLRGGVIYNPNNANNVVSAKIFCALGVNAMAVCNTHIGRLPASLRYTLSLPITSVFFSPDYDEAYYEIYLGNHHGLAHFGWWGNRFDATQALTADFRLGGTILRVGYRGGFEASQINHITTRVVTHSVVLGIGGEFLSLSPRKTLSPHAKIISAQY